MAQTPWQLSSVVASLTRWAFGNGAGAATSRLAPQQSSNSDRRRMVVSSAASGELEFVEPHLERAAGVRVGEDADLDRARQLNQPLGRLLGPLAAVLAVQHAEVLAAAQQAQTQH